MTSIDLFLHFPLIKLIYQFCVEDLDNCIDIPWRNPLWSQAISHPHETQNIYTDTRDETAVKTLKQ